MKLSNIVNGWWNLLKQKTVGLKNYFEEQVQDRRNICKGCKLNKNGVCNSTIQDVHYYTGIMTGGCSCPIEAKTASANDSCPLNKWQEILSEENYYHIKALANYNIIMYNGIVLFNNKTKNVFSSEDGKIIIPYIWVDIKLVKKFILIEMDKYITVGERSNILSLNDSLKDYLKSLERDENTDIILWIVNNKGLEVKKLRAVMDIYVSNYQIPGLRYIYTDNNDHEELNKLLEPYFYYYHKSKSN